ncbi:hypothetical protein HU200_016463 [Digitaria exilis]|uniref:Uncharacterized protein n=1 Tax=Digitaria exilis TaxID=1010633 RepID=A0A835F8J9_9POAL|nr:hypothetical protein HU200_016463 [Digitaria exilis]
MQDGHKTESLNLRGCFQGRQSQPYLMWLASLLESM